MVEREGQRVRMLYVLKSRGMRHSHEVRRFELTGRGFRFAESDGAGSGRSVSATRARGAPAAVTSGGARDDGSGTPHRNGTGDQDE
jgi:hypothetical protein